VGDERNSTGFHTIQHPETGELTRVVTASASMAKTIAGGVGAIVVIIGMLAGALKFGMNLQMNDYLGEQLKDPESSLSRSIRDSNEVLAAKITEDVEEMYESLRDQIQKHHDETRSTVWKATNPERHADDGEPPEEDD